MARGDQGVVMSGNYELHCGSSSEAKRIKSKFPFLEIRDDVLHGNVSVHQIEEIRNFVSKTD